MVACSGGGGGGPVESRDTTPPPTPASSLVQATLPSAGATTVTGAAGAVEAAATVIARNVATGVTAQAAASAEGAFSLTLAATIGDALQVTARDAAGNESPPLALSAGPAGSSIALAVGSGDGQIGVAGRPLPDPLRVRVTAVGAPLGGVQVRFVNQAPDGSLSATTATTDPAGFASVSYTLGLATGAKPVRAEILAGGTGHAAAFALEAVGAPVIESVNPGAAARGAPLSITGRNFSPVAGHTTVLIKGVPAAVVSATRTLIQTTMPYGLSGPASVEVFLTGVSSGPTPVQVLEGAFVVPPVGHAAFSVEPSGVATAFVPFETGAEQYVIAVEAATRFSFGFTLMASGTVPVAGAHAPLAPAAERPDLDAEVLAHGNRLLAAHGPARPATRSGARALVPAQTRTFWVLNVPEMRYESREARLEYNGSRVAVYVDAAIPASDFPTDEARALGQSFETSVYDPIRAAYGTESDLDANGKPIILMTPLVNIRADDEGTVLGFFNPGDLADHAHSNRGEIFYVLTPDPSGRWGFVTSPAPALRNLLVRVAAHEFVHMIGSNERHVVRRLTGQHYWLEEGLAHYGEHVVGRLSYANVNGYLRLGSAGVSLVGDQLLTRGASTLFVARLVERFGLGVLRRIEVDPATSTTNVVNATGQPWEDLFHDWSMAMYNELYPVPGVSTRFDSLDLVGPFSFDYGSPRTGNALGIFDRTLPSLALAASPIGMREGAVAFLRVRGGAPGQVGEVRLEALRDIGIQVTTIRVE